MTSRTFALSRQRRRRTGIPRHAATQAGLRTPGPQLPHERDQHVDPPSTAREMMVRSERDLAQGQADTDLRSRAAEVFERALAQRRGRS